MTESPVDRFLKNKWVIYDRLQTLRIMAHHAADDSFDDFDRRLFEALEQNIADAIADQTAEVKKREGR